jgi:hypothetical protein
VIDIYIYKTVFEIKKNKGPKQDSQNWLNLPMFEGGETSF